MTGPPYEDRRPEADNLETAGACVADALPMVAGTTVVDLTRLTPRDQRVWDDAHLSGWLAGFEAGARWADDDAATRHREAVRVVHAMARLPEAPPPSPHRDAERRRLSGRRSA